MQVLLLLTLAAAFAPAHLTSVDLSCDCRLWHLRDTSINLHCVRGQDGASRVSCQTAEEVDIPAGYRYIPGFALIKLYGTMKPWPGAKKACEDEGAQLAVPRNSAHYDGLKQFFKARRLGWGNIGVTDQASEGVFVGVDGRPVGNIPWSPGQPDNHQAIEHCVDYNSAGGSNDVDCANAAPYFCERPLRAPIPEGYVWVGDAGRFYKVHYERRVFAEAARECKAENGRLAVTDTRRRGEAALELFDLDVDSFQVYLVGFTDQAVEGDFVTETGRHLRDMEFQAWGINEPNNNDNGRPENCLALSKRGFYNDVRCDNPLPFICEILP